MSLIGRIEVKVVLATVELEKKKSGLLNNTFIMIFYFVSKSSFTFSDKAAMENGFWIKASAPESKIS